MNTTNGMPPHLIHEAKTPRGKADVITCLACGVGAVRMRGCSDGEWGKVVDEFRAAHGAKKGE